MGRCVVPPRPLVVGGAVENFVADVRVLEADAHQLRKVLRLHPDGEAALIDRSVGDIAYAQTGDAQAVLISIKRANRLSECLADAVARVRTHRDLDPDPTPARIE